MDYLVFDYVNITDCELVKKSADGSDVAFEILYERYFELIYGFVYKRVGHREVAEDLVSVIFTKVFVKRGSFKNVSFKAWVYRIATNEVIDYYRRNKNHFFETLDDHIDSLVSMEPSPEMILSKIHDSKIIHKALSNISIKYQELLHLHFFAELSYEEISEINRTTVNNIRVLIHRALKKFKQAYEKLQ